MTRNLRLLLCGGVGLALGTALALLFPGADGIPGTAMMLILCISSALCGAAVPGMIKFDSKPVRATGATVFFVLPWLVPPSSLSAASAPSTEGPAPPAETPAAGGRPTIRIPPPTATAAPAPPPKTSEKPVLVRPRTVFDSILAPKTK